MPSFVLTDSIMLSSLRGTECGWGHRPGEAFGVRPACRRSCAVPRARKREPARALHIARRSRFWSAAAERSGDLHLPHFSPWLAGLRPRPPWRWSVLGQAHGVLSNEQVQGRAVFCGPSPLPLSHRMGEGGELLWGRNPGRRSFLACPGLVCDTLSGFLGRERWQRFGVNGRVSRGKEVCVSILWLGLGRHGTPPGCAGRTPVDRRITKRRCGVRAGGDAAFGRPGRPTAPDSPQAKRCRASLATALQTLRAGVRHAQET